MTKAIFTFVLLAIISFGALVHSSDLKTIICTKDNTIIQALLTTTQNSNALYSITAGRTNQDGTNAATISIRRALVYFDIAGNIPSGAIIDSVRLSLYYNKTSGIGTTVNLHKVLKDWGEGTSYQTGGQGGAATQNDATWFYTYYNFSAPASSVAWTTPGGDFDPTIRASAYAGTGIGTGVESYGIKTWASTSMTTDVQTWLASPSTNFGWVLKGDESTGQTAKQYLSRETGSTSGTEPTAPALKVYYTTSTSVKVETSSVPTFRINSNNESGYVSLHFSAVNLEPIMIYHLNGSLVKIIEPTNDIQTNIHLSNFKGGIYLIKVGAKTAKLVVR